VAATGGTRPATSEPPNRAAGSSRWGYVDPVQRIHREQALRNLARPVPPTLPRAPYLQQSPVTPLAGLDADIQQAAYGNAPHRHGSAVESAVFWGAVTTAIGLWVRHNQQRSQNTTPGFSAMLVFLVFFVPGMIPVLSNWGSGGIWAVAGITVGFLAAVGYYHRTPKSSN
jgi:hypothetical protein